MQYKNKMMTTGDDITEFITALREILDECEPADTDQDKGEDEANQVG